MIDPIPEWIQLVDVDRIEMESALDQAFKALGMEPLGGASGKGWSRYNVIQQCPRKYYLRYIERLRGDSKKALEIGSAFHAFAALYYYNLIRILKGEEEIGSPSKLRDLLFEFGAEADFVAEAWRLFDAYADFYEEQNDYLIPLDVEVLCVDPETGNSCRFDLIAEIPEDVAIRRNVSAGVVAVDHKTAYRLDVGATEGWYMHGELIGQMYLWKRAGFDEKYGPLAANVANVVAKTKIVSFHREFVTPPDWFIEEQGRVLDINEAQVKLYEAMGYFPRFLSQCYGNKYGPCDYVERCKEK